MTYATSKSVRQLTIHFWRLTRRPGWPQPRRCQIQGPRVHSPRYIVSSWLIDVVENLKLKFHCGRVHGGEMSPPPLIGKDVRGWRSSGMASSSSAYAWKRRWSSGSATLLGDVLVGEQNLQRERGRACALAHPSDLID